MSNPYTRWYDRREIEQYARNWERQRSTKFIKHVQPDFSFVNRLRGTVWLAPLVRWYDRVFRSRPSKPKSMLHPQTLTLLDYFAGEARHGILEIGPYIGYSTIVMARALCNDIPLVTIEAGGSKDHAQLPSANIVADLKRNLAQEGVSEKVIVIEGRSSDEQVKREVRRHFQSGRKIDLLVIDADGDVGRDITEFRDLLAEGAVIMCDDYEDRRHDDGAELKRGLTSAWVDNAVQSGLLKELGVYHWGTWFGQYLSPRPGDSGDARGALD
jgi:predicted O-methyltransferase YrrM